MAVELEPDPAVACEPEPELEPDPAVAREPEPQCKNGWLCTCKAYSGSRGKPTHNQQCARKCCRVLEQLLQEGSICFA